MNTLTEKQRQQAVDKLLSTAKLPPIVQKDKRLFEARLHAHLPDLIGKLHQLYGHQFDFYCHLEQLVESLANGFKVRKRKHKDRDQKREKDPLWYRSEQMLGMAVYVDLFAGDFEGLVNKIPYLQSLGVNYLHLMPMYKSPENDSDGGYAVSDYRKTDPKLGSSKKLQQLADALNEAGISMVLDFVFNHTSDEHHWAMGAKNGDPELTEFYYFFADKSEVDDYNKTCREIFPSVRRGSFTHLPQQNQWVWTTFNSFQWDLNYSNPAVFNAVVEEMLFLANLGCEGLRLDALAFIWKEKGTLCESLPHAHTLVQCFNACLQIVAPSVLFKSEAIVHPDEVVKYIDRSECQLSYNPLLMALMWESLATRETKLLTASLKHSFIISEQCSWVNYIRCHDDIGWTFDDDIALGLGINGEDHRRFLNQFYTGQFQGSFAVGVPFQQNPITGDCRVCGSLASLTGAEQALFQTGKESALQAKSLTLATKRIRLLNSVNLSIGGIPLIYQGDELGLLNDYRYLQDDSKKEDSRWVNRPKVTQTAIDDSENMGSFSYRVNQDLRALIVQRKSLKALGQAKTEILETYRSSLFSYCRIHDDGERLLAICNFSERSQSVPISICDILGSRDVVDLLSETSFSGSEILLNGYDVVWLVAAR